MENKHRITNQGVVYLFVTPWSKESSAAQEAIDFLLKKTNSGRTLGSGVSLIYDNCVSVEIGAYSEGVNSAIKKALKSVNCTDFEISWDER